MRSPDRFNGIERWMVMGMSEKLIKLLNEVQDYGTKNTYGERSITVESKGNKTIADFLVANGVTIPVRCKDCKYMEKTPDGLRWCDVWSGINGMGDEGFCNYGERKQDEQNSL